MVIMTYKKWFKQVKNGSDKLTDYEISRFNEMDFRQLKKVAYALRCGKIFGSGVIDETEILNELYFLSGDLDAIRNKSIEYFNGFMRFRNNI